MGLKFLPNLQLCELEMFFSDIKKTLIIRKCQFSESVFMSCSRFDAVLLLCVENGQLTYCRHFNLINWLHYSTMLSKVVQMQLHATGSDQAESTVYFRMNDFICCL